MSQFLGNSLYEKLPFDACLLTRLILSRLDIRKGDFNFLLACVIHGVPPRVFPPCAENCVQEISPLKKLR